MTYKFGDTREDGYIWVGHHWRNGVAYDHWLSPEAFAKKRKNSNAATAILHKQKMKTDPAYASATRAYAREHMLKSRRANPALFMWRDAKKRAKEKQLAFDIDVADIAIPDTCPVLGIPVAQQEGNTTNNSPTLDRIDNTKGYVKGNVIVVSRRANILKRDATLEELQAIAKFYTKLKRRSKV